MRVSPRQSLPETHQARMMEDVNNEMDMLVVVSDIGALIETLCDVHSSFFLINGVESESNKAKT